MSEQVPCYKCRVWLDDFQTKVIDADDYCCECAFSILDSENERLQTQNAELLDVLKFALATSNDSETREVITEAIRKAKE